MATITPFFVTVMVLVATISAGPNNFSLKIPDECKSKKGFCAIKPEGYDEMQAVITKLLSSKFTAQKIGDRIGKDQLPRLSPRDDWHNCAYMTKTESVYAYLHPNTPEVDYIIQNELLNQPIEIVTCAYDHIKNGTEQCFRDLSLSSFDHRLESTCRSATAKRSLMVFDYKTMQITTKTYDVPCCCYCDIVKRD